MVDPANPKLDPSALESKSFQTKVRGFDPAEVRSYLSTLAAALRDQQRSASAVAAANSSNDDELQQAKDDAAAVAAERDELKASLATAERRADELAAAAKNNDKKASGSNTAPTESLADLDDDRLTELIGEETTRVLQSARTAAAEIRAKAEAEVVARREALETEEQEHRDRLASEKAAHLEELAAAKTESETTAETTVSNAKTEAAALMTAATADATSLRDTASADAETMRSEAAAEVEANRASGEEVANALKTRAEEVADGIRQSAEEEAALVREGAASAKADADAEAARIRAEAEADSTTSRDAAREEARLMLTEAQALREKVLSDLVEKRQVGRNQLDQTKAARDRLARSLGTVRRELEEAINELNLAVPEAKRALEGRTPPAEVAPKQAAAALAVELDTARTDGVAIPGVPREDAAAEVSEDDLFDRIRAGSGDDESESGDSDPTGGADAEAAADGDATADSAAIDDAVIDADANDSTDASATDEAGADGDSTDDDASADGEPESELSEPFVARDIAMTRFGPDLRRQFKRALADDQSDVLDRLRQSRKGVSVDQLPDVRAALLPYLDALSPALTSMADAGASHGGGSSAPSKLVDELVDRTARGLVEPMRIRIEGAVNAADDPDDVIEPIRAHYREFRTSILPELADDALAEAFAMGLYESIPKGTKLSWIADPRDATNADCHDNTLEQVKKPKNFPTGHKRPLGAPGCRCLVTAAD